MSFNSANGTITGTPDELSDLTDYTIYANGSVNKTYKIRLQSLPYPDTDGDGVGDNSDAFPGDASETLDTDGDGVGDNSDAYPYDATLWEEEVDRTLMFLGSIVVVLLVLVAYVGRRK